MQVFTNLNGVSQNFWKNDNSDDQTGEKATEEKSLRGNYRYGKPVQVFEQPGILEGTIADVHPRQLFTLRLSYPVKENHQTVNAFKAHKKCMQVLFKAVKGITIIPYKLNSNKLPIMSIKEFPNDPNAFNDYTNYAADNSPQKQIVIF